MNMRDYPTLQTQIKVKEQYIAWYCLNIGVSICPANRKNSRRTIRPVTLNAHVKNRYLSSSRSPRPKVIRSDDRMMAENAEIEIGNKFYSYEELESKIRLYELRTNTEFD